MDGAQIVTNILLLISGVGIFFHACNTLSEQIQALCGKKLKALFDRTGKTKLTGVAVGAVATAVIQSSGATTVTVIALAESGVLTLYQAATVIFGANIGTTVTGLLAALGFLGGVPSAAVFASFTAIGAFVFALARSPAAKRTGGALAAFGMLFAGLYLMSGSTGFLSALDGVRRVIVTFKNPVVLVLIGALSTAAVQSSSVMTAIAVTAVATGLITLDQGIYMIMGANVGSCSTALILSASGTANAKRAAAVHLIFNCIGVGVFLTAGLIMNAFGTGYGDIVGNAFRGAPQIALAVFHTVFNTVTVALVLPFTNRIVELSARLTPKTRSAVDFIVQ